MINELVAKATVSGIAQLYNQSIDAATIQVQDTKKEFEGDLTVVVFPLLRVSKKYPVETGEDLGNYLVANCNEVASFNVVKGFLNLTIVNSFWLGELSKHVGDLEFGIAKEKSGSTYMVEYSSPNTNKPLHLGHLRNIFLGHSVAEILKANGHEVYKTQIINDRGIHICKSMLAWQLFGNGETPESTGLKGDKFVGKYYVAFDKEYKIQIADLIGKGIEEKEAKKKAPILVEAQQMLLKWEAKDPEIYALWEKMNGWVYAGFEQTYQTMGVSFDKLYYESSTYILGKKVVEDGLADGSYYQKEDGSAWVDLSDRKMDDKLLLRADGTSVYMTQDIGTAIERYKDYPSLSGLIYTVGNEQEHHFKVLFAILQKLGFEWASGCSHLSYGMVELPSGKMKSREGTVVDADDLMLSVVDDAREMAKERGQLEGLSDAEREELYRTIGLGGLKYYLLRVDPKRGMMFNPEESIDLNGNTAPFVQYSYVRILSILKKADELTEIDCSEEIGEIEKNLIIEVLKFSNAIQEAGKHLEPSILVNYTFNLVRQFNSFYQQVSILKEENESLRNIRLQISALTATVIKNAMKLMGISVPNQM
ncbi:MAG: arginine--tRNA ligase [Flavobacteriales bacterium]|nr:arginine--tRNA ligase [Flavobacteriales bacterium]